MNENPDKVLAEQALRPQARVEFALVFSTSLHEATFIYSVAGERGICMDTKERTPQGKLRKRWVFKSTPQVDEAKALWSTIGMPKFGTPKDWDEMSLDEKKAVVNVVTAFAGNLSVFLKDVHG